MKVVLIESPYRNGNREDNLRYLSWCEYHSAMIMGECPIASHGNCTAYWPEDDEHRIKGFAWRERLKQLSDATVFYCDLGWSEGMSQTDLQDQKASRVIEYRMLPTELMAKFLKQEYPAGSMRKIPTPK